MARDHIALISSYCDRWCERCRYTERCATYACRIAAAMCGDVAAGIELAVGTAQPVDGSPAATPGETRVIEDVDLDAADVDIREHRREDAARRARLDAHPIGQMAVGYVQRSACWLETYRDPLTATGDLLLREALAIVDWDTYLIGAKVHRALYGRDRWERGEMECDEPVQSDWNGSAKVALLSLARSELAWRVLADATGDATALSLVEIVMALWQRVECEFSTAKHFVRPGFDEPWR